MPQQPRRPATFAVSYFFTGPGATTRNMVPSDIYSLIDKAARDHLVGVAMVDTKRRYTRPDGTVSKKEDGVVVVLRLRCEALDAISRRLGMSTVMTAAEAQAYSVRRLRDFGHDNLYVPLPTRHTQPRDRDTTVPSASRAQPPPQGMATRGRAAHPCAASAEAEAIPA